MQWTDIVKILTMTRCQFRDDASLTASFFDLFLTGHAMDPLLYAIPIFYLSIFVEYFLLRAKGKKDYYNLADSITSVHLGMMMMVLGLVVHLTVYSTVYEQYRFSDFWAMDSWVAWALAMLIWDFTYYWVHRMGHEVGALWATHIVHHSSEYYNYATSLRQPSLGMFVTWIFYMPMALMGIPPEMFIVVGGLNLFYQHWIHTELVRKLGWVDKILNTPADHRVHHGQNDYCIDKNYGGILIIWDRLFGTFEEERESEPVVYGVRKGLQNFNPIWGNIHYFADLVAEARTTKGWRAKLGVFMAPPGGYTDEPIAHFEGGEFVRYKAPASRPMVLYAAVQSLVMVALFADLFISATDLTDSRTLAYFGVVVLGYVSIGALLQASRWARGLELFRVAALGLALVMTTSWFGTELPMAVRVVAAIWALGSIAFLIRNASPANPEGALA
jgi:alkylglycerol monooxygenase